MKQTQAHLSHGRVHACRYIARSDWTPFFTLSRVRAIAYQCLTALAFIHANNLIHCDLKPENILIKSLSRCVVKVIDFGSSCFRCDPHSSYVQSRSYRAPAVVPLASNTEPSGRPKRREAV